MTSAAAVGLLTGLGEGAMKVGTMMATDQLETKRQKMLASLKAEEAEKTRTFQSERDENLFSQQKEMADIKQSHDIERDDKKYAADMDKTKYNKETVSADVLAKFEHDTEVAKSGGKISANRQKYLDLTSGVLDGVKYPRDWAVGVAYGGHKTTTDPRTKEMILLGPTPDDPSGFKEVGRMQPEDPNIKRGPKVWEPAKEPGLLGSEVPAPEGYAPARLPQNMQGQKDGRYSLKDGRILLIQDGQGYISN